MEDLYQKNNHQKTKSKKTKTKHSPTNGRLVKKFYYIAKILLIVKKIVKLIAYIIQDKFEN